MGRETIMADGGKRARDERLKAALRENLRRRKAQARTKRSMFPKQRMFRGGPYPRDVLKGEHEYAEPIE